METTQLILLTVSAYLLGSISSAVLICKLAGYPDPREQGSGNPGATNVYRIGGTTAAVATLVFDALKGAMPVLLAQLLVLSPEAIALVALAACLGHCYPLFFAFQGGKGVATALGAILACSMPLAVCLMVLWSLLFRLFRYSSLASIASAFGAPVLAYWLAPVYLPATLALGALLLWRHRPNIQRLKQGGERRFR